MSDCLPPDEVRRLLDEATPGPWEADGRGVFFGDDEPLCEVYEGTDADARLIAAAPPLASSYLDVCAENEGLARKLALLADAVEALLDLLVEDWTADNPVARDPWLDEPMRLAGYGGIWEAIHQARGVLPAARAALDSLEEK